MKPGNNPVIVLVFVALAAAFYFYNTYAVKEGREEEYRVAEVIDGDTIAIEDGKGTLVRYIGIDTPEIESQDSPGDPFARQAKEFNGDLVRGKKSVRLEYDNERYDVYGRLLAYVFADGVSVNEQLFRNGLATLLFIEPNVKYKMAFTRAADEARKEKKGIWGDLGRMAGPPGNGRFLIDLDSAPVYEGKRVVIRGRITGARKTEQAVVLSMEGKLDVVIFPGDLGNFTFFGIDPADYYNGKAVEVTGRIRMHRGTPDIVIDHPMLIRRMGE